jgi:hypothetical protein
MYNEKLIDYLQSCRQVLECSSKREEGEDSTGLTYLYFAPIQERLSLHVAENHLSHGRSNPFSISLTQKCQNALLDFRPYFDAALMEKKITSICAFPISSVENFSIDLEENFIKELKAIEQTKGALNALLTLRNWAYFPSKNKGSKNRKRFAVKYLGLVLGRLNRCFEEDKHAEMSVFLKWCGKRTRKILTWGFKEKELLSPHPSTLQIYKDESAAYIEYFLQMACVSEGVLKQQFAEMAICLSLCLACARKYSKGFSVNDILQVAKSSLSKIPQVISSKPIKDVREKSKGKHDALSLMISEDFLAERELWPSVLMEPRESNYLDQYCKIVRIDSRRVPISQRLAHAIELMSEFSLTDKDVENRLKEALKIVGLSQSSGGISPSCFLNECHYWKGVDLREHCKKDRRDINSISSR